VEELLNAPSAVEGSCVPSDQLSSRPRQRNQLPCVDAQGRPPERVAEEFTKLWRRTGLPVFTYRCIVTSKQQAEKINL